MKGLLKVAGIVVVASTAAAATVIAMSDENVRIKVTAAYNTVKNTAREMGGIIADGIAKIREEGAMSSTQKNQAWVDDQWEALGI